MESLHRKIPAATEIEPLQTKWREKGRTVETFHDLVLCYYCAIEIVTVPPITGPDGVPTLINAQFEKLLEMIRKATEVTHELRCDAGAPMGGETQEVYFRRAFAHFSEKYGGDNPFNFLGAENGSESGLETSGTHIINVATLFMGSKRYPTGTELFTALEPLIESSILLDTRRKGLSLDILGMLAISVLPTNLTDLLRGTEGDILQEYQQPCQIAKTTFFRRCWPCKFRDAKGNRCVNMVIGHGKGHQLEDGTVVQAGAYESIGTNYDFMDMFLKFKELPQGNDYSRTAVVKRHREILARENYASMWSSCHTTCLACLFSVPAHVLPCGHVLCDDCVDDFSEISRNTCTRTIRDCPLCSQVGKPSVAWTLKGASQQAAPRILSLDGQVSLHLLFIQKLTLDS